MIKISERFYINANSNCYTLTEKTKIQDKESKNYGQDVFKDIGYYTTLEGCLNGILKTTTREFISKDEVNNISDLKEQIKSTRKFLQSLDLKI